MEPQFSLCGTVAAFLAELTRAEAVASAPPWADNHHRQLSHPGLKFFPIEGVF